MVVGDVMLDCFVYGTLDRISPEAPIPILLRREEDRMLGGGGNVVANIVSLGARAVPLTVLGDDQAGAQVRAMMDALGVSTDGLITSTARQTSRKSRFIAQKQQVLRFDEEDRTPLGADDAQQLLDRLSDLLDTADIVILSDYGKGVLAAPIVVQIIAMCRKAGRPVLVDPKGPDYAAYAGATAVTPNRAELAQATNCATTTDADIEQASRQLVAAHNLQFVLATRSEEGMSAVSAQEAFHIATVAQEVFDVSGAGDTVIASFALAHAAGLDLEQAAAVANAAAGIAVAKRGTAQVSGEELIGRLAATYARPDTIGLDDAIRLRQSWKRQGLAVGFTNGCFDILHAGHVSLFRQARAACDRLIVGLNSDASVRRLKGDDRPVNRVTDRATVLAALEAVDAVVVFDEDTPLDLIAALRPDVLVKGADYTIEQVVGADIVLADKGRVVLAELTPDKSTTTTIDRMREPRNRTVE